MKVAIVCDWLVTWAGAEMVLAEMFQCFPEAELFSVVDYLSDDDRAKIGGRRATTTFLQKWPFSKTKYRAYLPLMPLAIEQLDLAGFDLIISSSHAVAKGVLTHPGQVHVCYVHSTLRYAWDLMNQTLHEAGMAFSLKGWVARYFLHKIRLWDVVSSHRVDYFIANSQFVAHRIQKYYRRDSEVIYPPVYVDQFKALAAQKEDYYIVVSRLVPHKRVELIVQAFAAMPERQLVVIGDGPEADNIKQKATSNIRFTGWLSHEAITPYLQKARAFVFAAIEDFGIAPVEAQAAGLPVIAFQYGGTAETVKGLESDAPTGVHFHAQTVTAIREAVEIFEAKQARIVPAQCQAHALQFSDQQFRKQFKSFVLSKLHEK